MKKHEKFNFYSYTEFSEIFKVFIIKLVEKIHTFTLLKPPNTVNLSGELLWKFEIRLHFDSFEKFWVSEHGCLHKKYLLTISASFFFRAIISELYAQS